MEIKFKNKVKVLILPDYQQEKDFSLLNALREEMDDCFVFEQYDKPYPADYEAASKAVSDACYWADFVIGVGLGAYLLYYKRKRGYIYVKPWLDPITCLNEKNAGQEMIEGYNKAKPLTTFFEDLAEQSLFTSASHYVPDLNIPNISRALKIIFNAIYWHSSFLHNSSPMLLSQERIYRDEYFADITQDIWISKENIFNNHIYTDEIETFFYQLDPATRTAKIIGVWPDCYPVLSIPERVVLEDGDLYTVTEIFDEAITYGERTICTYIQIPKTVRRIGHRALAGGKWIFLEVPDGCELAEDAFGDNQIEKIL